MRTRREREDEEYDMRTWQRKREDEIIGLTLSPSSSPHPQQQNATSHQEGGATGSTTPTNHGQGTTMMSSQEDATGGATASSNQRALQAGYCYICLNRAKYPVSCVNCGNIIGCMKHLLELSNFDNRCPICRDDSVLSSCIAHFD